MSRKIEGVKITNHQNQELVGKVGEVIRRDTETGDVWVRVAGLGKTIQYEACKPHNLKPHTDKLPQNAKDPTKPTGERKVEY